jgi:hypothetical protein
MAQFLPVLATPSDEEDDLTGTYRVSLPGETPTIDCHSAVLVLDAPFPAASARLVITLVGSQNFTAMFRSLTYTGCNAFSIM